MNGYPHTKLTHPKPQFSLLSYQFDIKMEETETISFVNPLYEEKKLYEKKRFIKPSDSSIQEGVDDVEVTIRQKTTNVANTKKGNKENKENVDIKV